MKNNVIAVILTVHNRRETTIKCLSIISNLLLPDNCLLKIYITDDGCTDGTSEEVKNKFPNVIIIKGDGNLFWNRGMIAAWKRAAKDDCDFYLWLNDDTMVYEDLFTSIYGLSSEKQHKSIVVGACEFNGRYTYGGRNFDGTVAVPNLESAAKVKNFNGNIVWIPKYVFEKVGYLDPYYRHSWGDVDYGLRAIKLGIESYQVDHYLGSCSRHETFSKWCNPDVPLIERLKAINKPTGLAPREVFHYEKQHIGFFTAMFHFVTVYVRCFFPNIWIRLGKAKI